MARAALSVILVLVALWAWAPALHAYIDPGAGSALLQALIGGVAVVAALVAHQWHRLRAWFSGRGGAADDPRQER